MRIANYFRRFAFGVSCVALLLPASGFLAEMGSFAFAQAPAPQGPPPQAKQTHSILVRENAEEPITKALDAPAPDASILEPAPTPELELTAPQNAVPAKPEKPAAPKAGKPAPAPAKPAPAAPKAAKPAAPKAAKPALPAFSPSPVPASPSHPMPVPAGKVENPLEAVPGQTVLLDDRPISEVAHPMPNRPVPAPVGKPVPSTHPVPSSAGHPVPPPVPPTHPVPPARPVPPVPPTEEEWNAAVQAFEQTISMMEEKRNQAARLHRHDMVRYLNEKISLSRQKLVIMKDEYRRAVRISNIEKQIVALEYSVAMGDRAAINRERALQNQRRVELEQSQRQQKRSQELSRKMVEMGPPPIP